jgi:hypothetical protein
MRRNLPFWIGDWINMGKALWPTTYTQVLDIEEWGYADQTVANYASICANVPAMYLRKIHRRVPPLTFSHSAVVARLAVPDQSKWLALAEREAWSHGELRDAIQQRETSMSDAPFNALVGRAINAVKRAKEKAPVECGAYVENALGYLEQARDIAEALPVGAPSLVSVSQDARR